MMKNARTLLFTGFAGLALTAAAQAGDLKTQPHLKPQMQKLMQQQPKSAPKVDDAQTKSRLKQQMQEQTQQQLEAAPKGQAPKAKDAQMKDAQTKPRLKPQMKEQMRQQQQMKATTSGQRHKAGEVQSKPIQIGPKPIGIPAKPGLPAQAKPLQPAACPDPAIHSFTVGSITSRPGPAPGYWPIYTVQLRAVLKNVGTGAYVSRPNQQAVAIMRRKGGSRDIKYQTFGDLAPGAQVVVSVEIRDWERSREFPPSFDAHIRYDPDIRKDGNPQNDDCRGSNNRRTITPEQINAAIDALPSLGGASSMRP